MEKALANKVAIITGSGQGIGKAIALAMVNEGAKVMLNDINRESAEALASEITEMGGQAIVFPGDVSSFNLARELIQSAVEHLGRVDILVNNAGIHELNNIWELPEKTWDKVLNVNLKGTFNCIRHACGWMKEQRWGRIINAASPSWLGDLEHCDYCASKAGVVGLTRAAAYELGRYGITCNAYCPGAGTSMNMRDDMRAYFVRCCEAGFMSKQYLDMLLNYPRSPAQIAPLIVYLASDWAADINGQVFRVSGGHIAIYSLPMEQNPIDKADIEKGLWTVQELKELIPKVVLRGYKNRAPAREDLCKR